MISPEFLYPAVDGGPAGIRGGISACALRCFGIRFPMTQRCLPAAANGQLSTREQIAQQARRMVDDPRARLKVHQSLLAWLRVDQPPELVKDAKKFPDFDPALASDLRTSLELFLDDIVSSENADFRQLLLSDDVFLNGRLAKIYGADLPADARFSKGEARLRPYAPPGS